MHCATPKYISGHLPLSSTEIIKMYYGDTVIIQHMYCICPSVIHEPSFYVLCAI